MRIAFYYPRALSGDGGMTNAVRRLSRSVRRAGADSVVICDRGVDKHEDEELQLVPIAHRHLARRYLPVSRELERALRGADLVVLNSAWTAHNVAAGRCASRLRIPYVVAPRGAYDPAIRRRHRLRKDIWWLAFERDLVAKAHAIQLSFAQERAAVEKAVGYKGPVLVVPNGVDIPADVQWDGGSGGYILWLGRFDPEHKGLDLIVRAVASLPPAERVTVRLCGPQWHHGKQQMERLVRELGVERWISIGEAVYGAAKWKLMREARGFLYPSRWEWFGNSLAEAAAIGLPCLVTPYPTGEFLAALGGAILVQPEPASLAAGLRRLVGPEAADIGKTARQVVEQHFGWDDIGRRFYEQSESLLHSPG